MKTLSQYLQNKNNTTDHIIPYNSTSHQPLSKIFSPPDFEHFITQDCTIKLMKTEFEVKKKELEELTRKRKKKHLFLW